MAQTLIENLTDEWQPEEFRDEYREALLGVVEKKVAGEEITVQPEAEPTKVVDLMEALKASVEAAKKKERPAAVPRAKSAARKSTAKKSTASRKRAAS